MKKLSLLLCLCCMLVSLQTVSQTLKWNKKLSNAIFTIVTYDKDDKILNTGNGFFIQPNGEAVSDYALFKGAERAIIVTSEGKEMAVDRILGANDMYDIIKFHVTIQDKKVQALPLATQPAQVNEKIWLLPYSTSKEAIHQQGIVTEVVPVNEKYHYYTLQLTANEKAISCPIVNAEGLVVGIMQQPVTTEDGKTCYAVDANYASSLSIGALTSNHSSLRAIGIKKALPPTEEEALVLLYMKAGQTNKEEYLELLNEFIETYPQSAEGYQRRATLYTQEFKDSLHFELAEADIAQAIELNEKKAEVYHTLCRMIYQNSISEQPLKYKDWGLKKALESIQQAIAIDSLPLYLQTEGELLFALQDYTKAYEAYKFVNESNMATALTFYSAAKSLQLSGQTGQDEEIIRLLDQAVNTYAKPYPIDAAPYVWERGKAYENAGKHRQAVMDFNEYHKLVNGKVNATFYYQREQAAIAGHMNQLALEDIAKAIELDSTNANYYAEQASLFVRFKMVEEAIVSCKKALKLDPEYADCYRILGICYIQQKKEEEACKQFTRAKELGDEQADKLIQKYCLKK